MPNETFASSTEARNDDHYRQVITPLFLRGTFANDDTDNHDFYFEGHGKSIFTVAIATTGTSTLTVSIFGRHNDSTGTQPPAAGVYSIGAFLASATGSGSTSNYQVVGDIFPYYMIRAQGPNDTVSGPTVTIFANLSAF